MDTHCAEGRLVASGAFAGHGVGQQAQFFLAQVLVVGGGQWIALLAAVGLIRVSLLGIVLLGIVVRIVLFLGM